jgi:hypothetical protein
MTTRNLPLNLKRNSALEFAQLTTNDLITQIGKQQNFHNATNLVALRHSTRGMALQGAVMQLESLDRLADDGGNLHLLNEELPLNTIEPNIPSSKARMGRDADTGAWIVSGHAEEG